MLQLEDLLHSSVVVCNNVRKRYCPGGDANLRVFFVEAKRCLSTLLKETIGFRSMYVANNSVPAALLQSTTQKPCILEVILSYRAISLKSEVHEVEVLSNNRRGRTGEVQRERVFD